MKKTTLKFFSRIMAVVLLASIVLQAPLYAVETIPVKVGGQTFRVTPGQWVSVRQGTHITHYNVRFVNGRPVALEMSQYTKLIFGESAACSAGVTNSRGNAVAGGSVADDLAGATNNSSGRVKYNSSAGSVADDLANANLKPANNPNYRPSAAGSVADDVAGANPYGGSQAPSGLSQSTSVADDVAQSGISGQTSQTSQTSQSSAQSSQAAGSVADDVAQSGISGQTSQTSQTSQSSAQSSQTTARRRAWDPTRHPRDPQTGRFISRQEAIERGIISGDNAGTAGSVADDVAQSGASGKTSAGSVADDVAQSNGKMGIKDRFKAGWKSGKETAGRIFGRKGAKSGKSGSFKERVAGKFHSGYNAGKGMVNQGFDNVKTSLKSGFSAKNLLVTAGITVGVDLATQIMRGEKPSAKKALKTVCSAEFVGGVSGAVVGAAAGSFFVPFLSAIPVVGGALSALAPTFGSIVGSSVGAYTAGDLKNGRFSIREAFKKIDWVGVAGQTIGSTAGAALGSALGPVGTIVGGIVGGYVGNWAAQKIANFLGKRKDGTANLPEISMPTGSSNPYGGYRGGEVTIGNDEAAVVETPDNDVTVSDNDGVIDLGGDSATVGTYESEVALAYSKYQELYKLYNELLSQGRQKDALSVAAEMNKAKAEYDKLKAAQK